MNPGSVVCLVCWGVFIAFIAYGLSFDVRRWLHRDERPDWAEIEHRLTEHDRRDP